MPSLAKRIAQLQRGLNRGTWSPTHTTRARTQLGSLQKRARMRREDRTLYNPEALLSGRNLRRATNAIVDYEAAPLERERTRIGAQAQANVNQIGQLFQGLAASQAAASQRAAGISAGANAQQGAIASGQQTALQGVAEKADEFLGEQGNPYMQGARAQLTQLIAQQKATATTQGAASATATAQLGANSEQLMNAMGQSQQMRGPELGAQVLARAAGEQGELGAKIADIRGPGRTKIRADLITGERNYLGAAKALDLDVQKLEETKNENQRDYEIAYGKLKEDRRHNRVSERQMGRSLQIKQQNADTAESRAYWQNKLDKWKAKHPNIALGKGGKGGATATPAQRRDNYNNFADVAAYVRRNPGAQKGDFGAPGGRDLFFKIANDPAYKRTRKIPKKYYAELHRRFPGVLTRGA